jgi:eukaryotic-like serine/threonine-protein kinase
VAIETGVLPDRYAGARPLGHGGMGELYVAEDRELGRKVAVKLLHQHFAGDSHLARRFKREALTAARLSGHPHVVTIYDVGEWHERPFIVMEFLPGGTVGDRARNAPVVPAEAIGWLRQAALALDDAHRRGIVHRDVKPANLLFDERGDLTIVDFGIARVADQTTGMTAAGTVLGTAGYLSPEQALGQPATPASDRYALAIVAYELLTGGRPFERRSATAEAAAHINEPVPAASERGVGLSRAVDAVFERALAKDPPVRYTTATDFVDALARALASIDEPTRVLPAPAPGPARPVARAAVTARRPAPWLPFLVAGLLLALVAGVGAAVFATGGGDDAATSVPARPREVTVTKEKATTVPGGTVTETIVTTVQAPAPTSAPPAPAGPVSIEQAMRLTDQATYALRRGDWEGAETFANQAYKPLRDTYSDQFRYEAYVNYDLGKALAELGRCQPALRYLARSEQLQGHRSEIDDARAACGG